MHALAEILAGILVIGGGGTALASALCLRRLRRKVRLVPTRPTNAPWSWLIHPGRAAQLHRRLRRSCRVVTGAVGVPTRSRHPVRRHQPTSPLTRVGAEVVDRAVTLDGRLVAADRLSPSLRRTTLNELAAEVRHVEAAALRLWRLDSVWREHQRMQEAGPATLAEATLDTRLDAMEAAMVELEIQPPGI